MRTAHLGLGARMACAFGVLALCIALPALAPLLQPDSASWSLLLGALGLCIAAVTLWALHRGIRRQIGEVASAAARLAAGDLGRPVDVRAPGELGELQRALHELGERMFTIIARVRTGTATLASTSGLMASDNSALSTRTEAQASALQQTASSVEELTATVRQNADNAAQASAAMGAASASARRGGEVVANVVDSMAAIKERSRQIAEITTVIDGIAFQTNILALNAAVEAARAGEEGRGFAVVAGEVRALAQRAAVAAKEIKALILGAVEQVEAGGERAAEAGRSMGDIVAGVERVAGLMSEIAAASAEQSAGIEEVNRAVMQIDRMTQENANLVEDARRTAAGLQEQAEELTEAAADFDLGAREFGSAGDAVAMVQEAVRYMQSQGRDALVAEVNKLGRGRFIDRDLYLSAYAADGRTVAHGTNRRFWNIDWTRFKDADGRLFIVDMVAAAQAAGRGWIEYKWVHPVSKRALVKTAYFEKCGDLVIACGIFKAQAAAPPPAPVLPQGSRPALQLTRA